MDNNDMRFQIKRNAYFSTWEKGKNFKKYLFEMTYKDRHKQKCSKSVFGFGKILGEKRNIWAGKVNALVLDFDKLPMSDIKRLKKFNHKYIKAKFITPSGKGIKIVCEFQQDIKSYDDYSYNYFKWGMYFSKVMDIEPSHLDKSHNVCRGNVFHYVGGATDSIIYNEKASPVSVFQYTDRDALFNQWYATKRQIKKLKIQGLSGTKARTIKATAFSINKNVNPKLEFILKQFPETANLEYSTNNAGFLISNRCPFCHLHSQQQDDYKTSYYLNRLNEVTISCFHNSCKPHIEALETKINKYTTDEIFNNFDMYFREFYDIFKKEENEIIVDKYLTEQADYVLDFIENNGEVVISADTGIGKNYFVFNTLTKFCRQKGLRKIVLVPTIPLCAQNFQDYGDENSMLIDGEIPTMHVQSTASSYETLISTYDGFAKILKANLDLSQYILVQDEIHTNLLASGYRAEPLKTIMEHKEDVAYFIGLTGTDYVLDDTMAKLKVRRRHNPFKHCKLEIIYAPNSINAVINEIVKNNDKGRKTIVLFNNKQKIREMQSYLASKNIEADIMDSTLKKKSEVYEDITQRAELSSNILITTQVIAEGININNKGVDIILCNDLFPHLQIQFVNRMRHGASTIKLVVSQAKKTASEEKAQKEKALYKYSYVKNYEKNLEKTQQVAELLNQLQATTGTVPLEKSYLLNNYLLSIKVKDKDTEKKYVANANFIKAEVLGRFWGCIRKNPIFIKEFYKIVGITDFDIIDYTTQPSQELSDIQEFRKAYKEALADKETTLGELYLANEFTPINIQNAPLLTLREIWRRAYQMLYRNERVHEYYAIRRYIEDNNDLVYSKEFKRLMYVDDIFKPETEEELLNIIEFSTQSTASVKININRIKKYRNNHIMDIIAIKKKLVKKDKAYLEYQVARDLQAFLAGKEVIDIEQELLRYNNRQKTMPLTKAKFLKFIKLFAEINVKKGVGELSYINDIDDLSNATGISQELLVKYCERDAMEEAIEEELKDNNAIHIFQKG